MLIFLKDKKQGQQLWSPSRTFHQVAGPKWISHNRDELWDKCWHQKRWNTELSQADVSWWVQQAAQPETDEHEEATDGANKSIFHAQAEEIRSQGNTEQHVFQYTGLTDWRSVACRVLNSIG